MSTPAPLHPLRSSHCKYLISKIEAPLGLTFYSKTTHEKAWLEPQTVLPKKY